MAIKLQAPIAGMKLTRYFPAGSIGQFFGENLSPLYQLPVAQGGFGMLGHNGIDIVVPTRTPVLAAHDGNVTTVFNESNASLTKGYGVYVTHPEGWFTVYWHMMPPNIVEGTPVRAGDAIGYSNNSGQSTGPHLHFALYDFPRDINNGYGGARDPLPFLQISLLSKILGLLQQVFSLKGRIVK